MSLNNMERQRVELLVATIMLCIVIFVFPVGKVSTLVDVVLHAGVSLLPIVLLIVILHFKQEELSA